jgi:hypothetical protein
LAPGVNVSRHFLVELAVEDPEPEGSGR